MDFPVGPPRDVSVGPSRDESPGSPRDVPVGPPRDKLLGPPRDVPVGPPRGPEPLEPFESLEPLARFFQAAGIRRASRTCLWYSSRFKNNYLKEL